MRACVQNPPGFCSRCLFAWPCRPLLLLPPIPPSIRVFSNESTFAWGGQSIGVSASASVLPMKTQDWSPLLLLFLTYFYFYLYPLTIINCNCEYKSFRWILCLSSESSNGRWSWRSQNSQLIPGVRVNLRTHNIALSNWCSNVTGSTRLFDICNIHLSIRIVSNTSSTSYAKPVTYTQASKLWTFPPRFFE